MAKIKLKVDYRSEIALTKAGSNSTLVIEVAYVKPWEEKKGTGDGRWNFFSTATGKVPRTDIDRIKITGSEKELELIQKLIFLKDDVKSTKDSAKNKFDFEITNLKHNFQIETDHWDVVMVSNAETGFDSRILNLTDADFIGNVSANDMISINDTDYNANIGEPRLIVTDRDTDQKKALLDLEVFLDILDTRYKGAKSFDYGPELNFIDVSDDISQLETYKYNHSPVDDDIKYILYDLRDGIGNHLYKDEIDNWITYLKGIEKWRSCGFTKKTEVAKALANGYKITDVGKFRLEKEEVKYRDFPIIKSEQVATEGATVTDKITITNPSNFKFETKIVIDTYEADSLDQAIDLAFFGKDYSATEKTSNTNLYFNELENEKNELEMLEVYFEAFKEASNRSPNKPVGKAWNNVINDETKDSRKKIEKKYGFIKEFLDLYTKNFDDWVYGKPSANKGELEKLKKNLKDYKSKKVNSDSTIEEKQIATHWERKITDKCSKIKELIDEFTPQKRLSPNVVDKIERLIVKESSSDLAKKVYTVAKKLKKDDIPSIAVVNELNKIVELVKKAHGGTHDDDTLARLRDFSSSSNNEKKKAWIVAKKVKEKKDDIESWVEKVLKKLEKELVYFKTIAKVEMDKVEEDKIFNKIVTEDVISANLVRKITKLFQDATVALKSNEFIENLDRPLQIAKDNETDDWKAIEKCKKKDIGYGTRALEHLESKLRDEKMTIDKILTESKSTEEFEKALDEYEKKIINVGIRKKFREVIIPRYKSSFNLEKSSNKSESEVKLSELLRKGSENYRSKKDLKVLEEDIKIMESFSENIGNESEKGRAVEKMGDSNSPKVFEYWIVEMKERLREIKKSQKPKKKEKRKSPEDSFNTYSEKPFKTILILSGTLLILLLIIYFFKNVSSKNEK